MCIRTYLPSNKIICSCSEKGFAQLVKPNLYAYDFKKRTAGEMQAFPNFIIRQLEVITFSEDIKNMN